MGIRVLGYFSRHSPGAETGGFTKVIRNCLFPALVLFIMFLWGCRTPEEYHKNADEVAAKIITQKQQEALGKTESFSIERPSDILRRRLMAEQGLAFSTGASLGTDKLRRLKYWPEADHSYGVSSQVIETPIISDKSLRLSLLDTLQIGARNSSDYQSNKETVFQNALALDLARNDFRTIIKGSGVGKNPTIGSTLKTNTTGDSTVTDVTTNSGVGVSRKLKNGISLSAALAADLVNLLTQGGASSLGLTGDASVTIPLLRGAGKHIVTEPLTQAERDVIYAMYDFERYKRTFAVSIARDYFSVLRQMDSVTNAEDRYRSAVTSARWARRRGDAGLMSEIQVDQAFQQELSSRNSWISAQQRLRSLLDSFKNSLGLPTDAFIELDPNDLQQLRIEAEKLVEELRNTVRPEVSENVPPADAPVELIPASYEDAGPYEMDESSAIKLAFENRLDLRMAVGEVYDAQRKVVVAADNLKAGLNLGGSLSRSYDDSTGPITYQGGTYRGLLSLDLPFERTSERNAYRNSLISLERATRSVQSLEDQIKLSVRTALRSLLESRESLKIQAQSVVVAEKQERSSKMFLEAGRIEIRDLLDAQAALLRSRNDLTAAVVTYRTTELELQRDLGVLGVNEKGLWQEFSPEGINHVRK